MRDDQPRNTSPKSDGLDLRAFAGSGLQFAGAIVIFVLLGQWVDKKFDTGPAFLLIGLFVGGGATFFNLYRKITAAQKADDERRRLERNGGKP
ncbi:MAG TPA: AtpZ/AtpI family protein [Gemmatimonadaceae bacterium]